MTSEIKHTTSEEEIYELIEECQTMLEDISDSVNIGDVEDLDWLKTELIKLRDSIVQV